MEAELKQVKEFILTTDEDELGLIYQALRNLINEYVENLEDIKIIRSIINSMINKIESINPSIKSKNK